MAARFAVQTFVAGPSPGAANAIVGGFQRLKSLSSPGLAPYIDIVKGKAGRLFVVSEGVSGSLRAELEAAHVGPHRTGGLSEARIRTVAGFLVRLLAYLASASVTVGNLGLDSVLSGSDGALRLADYGLSTMTEGGSLVSFPLVRAAGLAPEVLAGCQPGPKADVWSLGLLLVELAVGRPPWGEVAESPSKVLDRLLDFCGVGPDAKRGGLSQPGSGYVSAAVSTGSVSPRSTISLSSAASSKSNSSRLSYTANPFLPEGLAAKLSAQASPTAGSSSARRAGGSLDPTRPATTLDGWLKGSVSASMLDFVKAALTLDPAARPDAASLQSHPWLAALGQPSAHGRPTWVPAPDFPILRLVVPPTPPGLEVPPVSLADLEAPRPASSSSRSSSSSSSSSRRRRVPAGGTHTLHPRALDSLAKSPLADLFHFFVVSGGDLQTELDRLGALPAVPPIANLPLALVSHGSASPDSPYSAILPANGRAVVDPALAPPTTIILPTAVLRSFISQSPAFSRLTVSKNIEHRMAAAGGPPQGRTPDMASISSSASLISASELAASSPLSLREADMAYQGERIRTFQNLLAIGGPAANELVRQAKIDIPPVLRGQIWAAILGVMEPQEVLAEAYVAIDKEAPSDIDRQLEVDLPRCHQYHPLVSSPDGQAALRRIIKAWNAANPSLVYWQGLDSLTAPLLVLHFTNEPKAFACLQALVNKYVASFFTTDTVFLQEHLSVYSTLLAYHDPQLAAHLANQDFNPDLYAIPWFLTLFAHVFPLEKIYHLWDVLLLGPPSLPLFLAIAMVRQLRSSLLAIGFDDLIGYFSSLPNIELATAMSTALELFEATPASLTFKRHTGGTVSSSSPWWDAPVPLQLLQAELPPRIDPIDMLAYPSKTILDLRSAAEFSRCHFSGAINLPPSAESVNVSALLRGRNGTPIILILPRSGGPAASELASNLVRSGFQYVSILHGGIDRLKKEARSWLVQYASSTSKPRGIKRRSDDLVSSHSITATHGERLSSGTRTSSLSQASMVTNKAAKDPLGIYK